MLIEIACDKFSCYGKQRPAVQFHSGLNTVMGDEAGSNSIGKSTFLLIIDFAFGGDDYVLKSTDVQAQVGPHDIRFAFVFAGKRYYFSRNTIEHTKVWQCNEEYQALEEMTKEAFRAKLLTLYAITLPHITFRDIVERYFRIYGRDNLDEHKPLNIARNEAPKKAIITLMKLFGVYAIIHDLEIATQKSKEEMSTYKKAQDFHFIPRIGKRQLLNNRKRIEELQGDLAELQVNSSNELIGLDKDQAAKIAELKKRLTTAKRQKTRLLSQLHAIESDMHYERELPKNLFDFSTSPGHLRAHAFQKLKLYFPAINLQKINEVETFHEELVGILNKQYKEARQQYLTLIATAEEEIVGLEAEIQTSGLPPKISRATLEKYAEKKGQIIAIEKENETYSKLDELKTAAKSMEKHLLSVQEEQMGFLQSTINTHMDRLNDSIYYGKKKPPVLHIKKPNSYTFQTPDDTGTGTSYKGLVVFDLSILQLTDLPALIHDSVILKQIGDAPLEQILSLYSQTPKQVFIALDKKSSYTHKTQKMLEESTVLSLSNEGNELFGRSWNTK